MLSMGNSTISMAIFNSFLYVYQRANATLMITKGDYDSSHLIPDNYIVIMIVIWF